MRRELLALTLCGPLAGPALAGKLPTDTRTADVLEVHGYLFCAGIGDGSIRRSAPAFSAVKT